jgi:hypothetical protein
MGEPVSKVCSAGDLRKTFDFSWFRGGFLAGDEVYVEGTHIGVPNAVGLRKLHSPWIWL